MGCTGFFQKWDMIQKANCVVAVAGMEGALASVMGGLVCRPVIAVPTSVGYGANFHGLSALLTMINSCANGIAVVNIDNGYGAGYLATQMNRLALGKGQIAAFYNRCNQSDNMLQYYDGSGNQKRHKMEQVKNEEIHRQSYTVQISVK